MLGTQLFPVHPLPVSWFVRRRVNWHYLVLSQIGTTAVLLIPQQECDEGSITHSNAGAISYILPDLTSNINTVSILIMSLEVHHKINM